MNQSHCPRDQEVIEAVRLGRWPEACDESLREHISNCAVCREVALVAQLFQRLNESARQGAETRLPESAQVWWKAQLVARREVMERAQQPIALVEKVALASSILSLIGVAIWQWAMVSEWISAVTNSRVFDPILSPWYLPFKYLLVLIASASVVLVGLVLYTLWAED